MIIRTLN
jgi:hypothetical protein